MSFIQDGITFDSEFHTTPLMGLPTNSMLTTIIPGVKGELHLLSDPHGQDIAVRYTLYNWATLTGILGYAYELNQLIGSLDGPLTLTLDGTNIDLGECTFMGYEPEEFPFYDGSGQWGWIQRGILRWRRRTL